MRFQFVDTKISNLTNSLTKATVATNDIVPIVDTSATETKKITYQELIQPTDANFRIAGSADNTKLVAFEVDGLTTATTRTITIPDANTTLVGTDTTQTLTNKTLTSPQINMASNATGDIYYRDGSGVTSRLAIGSTDQILAVQSGLPAWISNPSASDSSYSTKGIVKFDTDAATSGVTVTSGVATLNTGTTANKILKLNSSAQIPAVDGSLLTGIVPSTATKVNITVADGTVSGTGTETDFLTVSIPGGTLGTANGIMGKVYFTATNSSTTSKVLKLIYGSTTVATVTMASAATTAVTWRGYIDFMLLANGSASSQEGSIFIHGSESNTNLATATGLVAIAGGNNGTATEVSSGALNLKLSWTQNSGETFTMSHAVITKIF